jgi:hypothetical protein
MTAVHLLHSSADEQDKDYYSSPATATARRQLAVGRGEIWLTRPYPGGLGSEAALLMDRDRDRNRGGTEQDEFYHGENIHR